MMRIVLLVACLLIAGCGKPNNLLPQASLDLTPMIGPVGSEYNNGAGVIEVFDGEASVAKAVFAVQDGYATAIGSADDLNRFIANLIQGPTRRLQAQMRFGDGRVCVITVDMVRHGLTS